MIISQYDYYAARVPTRTCDDYWDRRVDPDGNVRERIGSDEERQYVEDVADEISYVASQKPHSVLDVGCGPGWFLSALPGNIVKYGTDICKKAMDEAEARGVISLLSYGAFQFDVVRCHHVIEHMPEPITELRRMRLATRRTFILSTPDFGSPCAERFGGNYRMLRDETHCSLFTLESMTRALIDVGFILDRITFPFPDRYATPDTMARWLDTEHVSPPWPGNWMTFYCTV